MPGAVVGRRPAVSAHEPEPESGRLSFGGRMAGVTILVVALWVLYQARDAIVLLYLGFLLAVALSPLVRLVERYALRPIGRYRLPRPLAIFVLYVAILVAIAGIVFLVASPIAAQAEQLWHDLPGLLSRFEDFLLRHGILHERLGWQDLVRSNQARSLLGTVKTTSFALIGGLFGVVVIVFLTFYLLVESRTLFEEALRFVPERRRDEVRAAAVEVTHKVSAWLGGHVLLGTIMGATTSLVLGPLGVPYFYVLAILSFVGEFVPYLGPLLSAVPGVLIALTISWTRAIEVGFFFLVQQQCENHVLVPQIFERQVGLSAVTVIVALTLGGSLLGILGIVMAVPTAAIIQVIVRHTFLRERG